MGMAISMAKKVKTSSIAITAINAREVIKASVHSPFNHGIDRVDRVVDTVDVMFRRRQLDAQQKRAADTYRDAFDALTASMGGSMDFDRVRGGSSPGAPPAPTALLAADTVAQAHKILGAMDSAIIEMIVGRGYSIEQCAARTTAGVKKAPSDRDTEYVGKRLRDALTTLADEWHPVGGRRSPMRSFIEDGAKPVSSAPSGTRVMDVRVAHASETKVTFSDQEKARK